MPLVISHRSKQVVFVRSEEVLGEILGHTDFDGNDWAVGDMVLFEDGTSAFVEADSSRSFHTWSTPASTELSDAVAQAARYDQRLAQRVISSWQQFFELLSTERPKLGPWRRWFR